MSDYTHTILPVGDRFHVVRTIPTTIAEFAHREDAELFLRAKGAGLPAECDGEGAQTPDRVAPMTATAAVEAIREVFTAGPEPAPSAATWDTALARVAAGEGCKAVAEEMGLRFAVLRGRWANLRSRQARAAQDTEAPEESQEGEIVDVRAVTVEAPVAAPMAVACTPSPASRRVARAEDDYVRPPVRSALLDWSADEDAAVASARDEEITALAQRLGRSVSVIQARRELLARQVAREMSDV